MNVIFLPYAEEIRSTKKIEDELLDNEGTEPTRQQVIAAKKMINALTAGFDPNNFENPNIQSMYNYLQALALNEPQPETTQDYLQPDYEGMKKVEPLIISFRDLCYGEDYVDPEERVELNAKLQKRKRSEDNENGKQDNNSVKKTMKTVKKEMDVEEENGKKSDNQVEELLKEGKGTKLTLAQLKEYLESNALETKGVKKELLERANLHLSTK